MKRWKNIGLIVVCLLLVGLTVPVAQNTLDTPNSPVVTVGNPAYAAEGADYSCDGVADNVQFQAALNALPATGGTIRIVSTGTFVFNAAVSRAINNVTIEGMGRGTYLTRDGVNPIFDAGTQTGWVFRDFRTDAGWLDVAATTDYVVSNVMDNATDVGKTIRTATLVVAASDASENSKAQADYICDGTADEVQINTAITAASGGEVKLTEGTFYRAATLTMGTDDTILTGSGWGTVVTASGIDDTAILSITADDVQVKDIFFDCDIKVGGITIQSTASHVLIENVKLIDVVGDAEVGGYPTVAHGIEVKGDYVNVVDCYVVNPYDDCIAFASSASFSKALGNVCLDATRFTSCGIEIEDGATEIIADSNYVDNTSEQGITAKTHAGAGASTHGIVISNNILRDMDDYGIYINALSNSVYDVVVVGNEIRGIDKTPVYGLYVCAGSPGVLDDITIVGNTVENVGTAWLYVNGDAASDQDAITNLTIGNNEADSGYALLDKVRQVVMESNVTNGGIISNDTDILQEFDISGNYCTYIYLYDARGGTVRGNIINGGGGLDDSGITTRKNYDVVYAENKIYETTNGIDVNSASNGVHFINNQIRFATAYGIKANLGENIIIRGNDIYGTGTNGIYIDRSFGAKDFTILDNNIEGSLGQGIRLESGGFDDIVVNGNDLSGCTIGIEVRDADNVEICDNFILDRYTDRSIGFSAGAALGQPDIEVDNTWWFFPGQTVTLKEGATTEDRIIQSIDRVTETITMTVNLANNYTAAASVYPKALMSNAARIDDLSNGVVSGNYFGDDIWDGGGYTNIVFSGNRGYIGQGEVQTISAPITAGAQNTVTSIQNTFENDVTIVEAYVIITTAASAANPTYDMGTDDDGAGAPSVGNNLFEAIPDTVGYYRSTSNGLGVGASGVQIQPIEWGDGGGNDYVNFIITDAAGADTAGMIYITVIGQ